MFSNRISKLPGSKIRQLVAEISKLKRCGIDVYEFHVGQPGLPPCKEMIEEFTQLLLSKPFEVSRYTPTTGLEEFRQIVAEDYSHDSGISIGIENVCITTGSAEAIITTYMTLIDKDDEIVMFDPEYLLYKPLAEYFEARVKTIPVKIENNFNPNHEELKNTITRKTKIVILVSPDNPTGAVLNEEVIKTVTDLAKDYDFYIIYDEAYRNLYYEDNHIYAIKYDFEHVIAFNTFSKDPALPGWRIGYIIANDEFIKTFARVKQYVNLNPPTPAQYLAMLYLTKYKKKYLQETLPIYRERRDVMYNALVKYLPEAKVMKPKAGLFIFPKIETYLKKLNVDDEEFTKQLLKEKRVSVVPGSAFGEYGKYHIRLCFAKENPERIREGIAKIAEFIEEKLKH